jgi:transposase
VLYRYWAGISWRDLPERFGEFRVNPPRHTRWSKCRGLATYFSGTCGRSRGGLSKKIHATVDALGNPTGFHLTPGQAHELEGADALLSGTPAATVIADKACEAQERFIDPLPNAGKAVVIPPRRCCKQPHEITRYMPHFQVKRILLSHSSGAAERQKTLLGGARRVNDVRINALLNFVQLLSVIFAKPRPLGLVVTNMVFQAGGPQSVDRDIAIRATGSATPACHPLFDPGSRHTPATSRQNWYTIILAQARWLN